MSSRRRADFSHGMPGDIEIQPLWVMEILQLMLKQSTLIALHFQRKHYTGGELQSYLLIHDIFLGFSWLRNFKSIFNL